MGVNMSKRVMLCALAICLSVGTQAYAQEVPAVVLEDSTSVNADSTNDVVSCEDTKFVVYYFHGEKRCMTCRKIEALAQQSLRDGFGNALADSVLEWRVVNFEDEANAHYAKAYKLFTQTLIVSRLVDGEEAGWLNLDQIWQLVHDEDAFISYVQTEVDAFMKAKLE